MEGDSEKEDSEVVFITGCSDGGLGASLAYEFARIGYQVVASSRSLASMKELGMHDNIQPVALDVTDLDAVKRSVDNVVADYGHIDILVNNAGVFCMSPIAEVPLSKLEATFKTNVFGPVALIQAVIPHMVARGQGRIANIGSIETVAPRPWAGGYVSSKAALDALTDALRMELKPFGIPVVLIIPGAITSNLQNTTVATLQSGGFGSLKLYEPFQSIIMKCARTAQNLKCTPTEVFARKAVAKIVAKSPPAHYVYGRLTAFFIVLSYLPLFIRDAIWAKVLGLDKKVLVSDRKAK